MKNIKNEVISASAGSGKTFQLTNRYISLLANGISPDRIIALTFTRKAAGEIFDSMINKLWEWHKNFGKEKTARNISEAGFTFKKEEIFNFIKSILNEQQKIQISTLDSFFVKILQNFPMEFGIDGYFEITDPYLEKSNREKILKQILSSKSILKDTKSFIEEFRKSQYGKEAKNIKDALDEFVKKYIYCYMLFPGESTWEVPGYLADMVNTTPKEINDIALQLKDDIGLFTRVNPTKENPPTKGQKENMLKYLDEASVFLTNSIFTDPSDEIFTEILKNKYKFKGHNFSEVGPLKTLCQYLLKCICTQYSIRTKGIHSILKEYDRIYDVFVRNAGKLSFADIIYILNGKGTGSHPLLSGIDNSSDMKLYVDMRLDSSFDHWLIDEFQDTSRLQWNIISNLIDEVINDPVNKSFFYVGDIKQAIYAWRGGDSQLFEDVYERYKDNIEKRELNVTRRSAPQIIETVKDVFIPLIEKGFDGIPKIAVEKWKIAWGTDEVKTAKKEQGYSVLFEANTKIEDDDDKYGIISDIIEKLKELKPVERGLSVGILTYRNEFGKTIAEKLKINKIPVCFEGSFTLTDSPAVNLLISLLKFLYHPADTISCNHLLMSPLAGKIPSDTPSDLNNFIHENLDLVSRCGFSGLMKKWISELESSVTALTGFDKGRLKKLLIASENYDATGNSDCLDFISYLESYEFSAESSKGVVQVMTVHKSKGLGFDIVFLPELKEAKGNMNEETLDGLNTLYPNEKGFEGLCSLLPKKDISKNVESLSEYIESLNAEHCYEKLCCLYVAMTRTIKALYMYAPVPSDTGKALTTDVFLKKSLINNNTKEGAICDDGNFTTIYQRGDPKWYKECSLKTAKTEQTADISILSDIELKKDVKIEKETPSSGRPSSNDEDKPIKIRELLITSDKNIYAETGICIHYMFEKIDYLDKNQEVSFTDNDKKLFEPELWEKAYSIFKKAVSDPNIRSFFVKKESLLTELWKEKTFSMITEDGKLLSGQFDRVEILRSSEGKFVNINIIDYKCENPNTPESEVRAKYSYQMEAYKKAICSLLKIPECIVSANLLLLNRLAICKI